MRNKLLFILLLLMFPLSCKAYECSYAEQARLRKLASNIQTNYDYKEVNGNISFDITLSNLNNDLYIYDDATGKSYYPNGRSEITLSGYTSGEKVKYRIFTTKSNCISTYLNIKYVNLPDYNRYYNDPICSGKKYNICNKWTKVSMTYEDFVKKINELDNVSNETPKEETLENTNWLDYAVTFIYDNYIYIGAGLVLFFILIELLKRRKNSFNW